VCVVSDESFIGGEDSYNDDSYNDDSYSSYNDDVSGQSHSNSNSGSNSSGSGSNSSGSGSNSSGSSGSASLNEPADSSFNIDDGRVLFDSSIASGTDAGASSGAGAGGGAGAASGGVAGGYGRSGGVSKKVNQMLNFDASIDIDDTAAAAASESVSVSGMLGVSSSVGVSMYGDDHFYDNSTSFLSNVSSNMSQHSAMHPNTNDVTSHYKVAGAGAGGGGAGGGDGGGGGDLVIIGQDIDYDASTTDTVRLFKHQLTQPPLSSQPDYTCRTPEKPTKRDDGNDDDGDGSGSGDGMPRPKIDVSPDSAVLKHSEQSAELKSLVKNANRTHYSPMDHHQQHHHHQQQQQYHQQQGQQQGQADTVSPTRHRSDSDFARRLQSPSPLSNHSTTHSTTHSTSEHNSQDNSEHNNREHNSQHNSEHNNREHNNININSEVDYKVNINSDHITASTEGVFTTPLKQATPSSSRLHVKPALEPGSPFVSGAGGRLSNSSSTTTTNNNNNTTTTNNNNDHNSNSISRVIPKGKAAAVAVTEAGDEWKKAVTPQGKTYFYNRRTRVSAWK
jgi:hypothetical protein